MENQRKEKERKRQQHEPLFKKFCNSWKDLDTANFHTLEIKDNNRTLLQYIDEAKSFLTNWLKNEKTMREDYLEMAKLCIVYLGGVLPQKFPELKLRAPSAYHHARWMSKVLYVLKIAMLKTHFVKDIGKIQSLALFYCVFYSKAWLTCMAPAEAPSQDLAFIKSLERVCSAKGTWPVAFQQIAKAALDKMLNHTWY